MSSVYGGRMIDAVRIYLWTWDARPYPAFPAALDVWSDGANWETGHWLTGRLGGAPLDALVGGDPRPTAASPTSTRRRWARDRTAIVIDRPMSPRAALEPLTTRLCVRRRRGVPAC